MIHMKLNARLTDSESEEVLKFLKAGAKNNPLSLEVPVKSVDKANGSVRMNWTSSQAGKSFDHVELTPIKLRELKSFIAKID